MITTSPSTTTVVAPRAGRSSLYTVRPTAGGLWRVEAASGLVQGVFSSRRDAVRFAVFEMGGHCNAVILDTDGEGAAA